MDNINRNPGSPRKTQERKSREIRAELITAARSSARRNSPRPRVPKGTPDAVAKHFRFIVNSREPAFFHISDTPIIIEYCRMLARLDELHELREVDPDCFTYETQNGQIKSSPIQTEFFRVQTATIKLADLLGLTPSKRHSRRSALGDLDPDPLTPGYDPEPNFIEAFPSDDDDDDATSGLLADFTNGSE